MPTTRNQLAGLLGLWSAATLGPVVALAFVGPFDGTVSVTAGATVIAVGTLGALVARSTLARVADPGGRLRKGAELAVLMLLGGVPMLMAFPIGVLEGTVAAAPFAVGGTLAVLTAFLVGYVADRVVLAREQGDKSVTFRARKPPASRTRRWLAAVAVLAAAVWGATVVNEGEVLLAVVPFMLALAQVPTLLGHYRTRRYEITDAGLVVWSGHLDWETVDGFAVTDSTLVVHGNAWPFGTVELDRESIDDFEAVVSAFDHHLPRIEGDHDDPSPLDNVRRLFGSGSG